MGRRKKYISSADCEFNTGLGHWCARRGFPTSSGFAISVIPLEAWTDPSIRPTDAMLASLAPQFEAMRESVSRPSA